MAFANFCNQCRQILPGLADPCFFHRPIVLHVARRGKPQKGCQDEQLLYRLEPTARRHRVFRRGTLPGDRQLLRDQRLARRQLASRGGNHHCFLSSIGSKLYPHRARDFRLPYSQVFVDIEIFFARILEALRFGEQVANCRYPLGTPMNSGS